MAKLPKGRESRARTAATFQLFVQQYARKAQKGQDPNDRRYDRSLEAQARRMRPEELDALLRHGDEDTSA